MQRMLWKMCYRRVICWMRKMSRTPPNTLHSNTAPVDGSVVIGSSQSMMPPPSEPVAPPRRKKKLKITVTDECDYDMPDSQWSSVSSLPGDMDRPQSPGLPPEKLLAPPGYEVSNRFDEDLEHTLDQRSMIRGRKHINTEDADISAVNSDNDSPRQTLEAIGGTSSSLERKESRLGKMSRVESKKSSKSTSLESRKSKSSSLDKEDQERSRSRQNSGQQDAAARRESFKKVRAMSSKQLTDEEFVWMRNLPGVPKLVMWRGKLIMKNSHWATIYFKSDHAESITLMADEAEDMWHAYNLVCVDDNLRSTTIRKVQNESATGSVSASKVRTTLTIRVETIDFDTQGCVLRVKGRNIVENQYVKMGAYHTLDLELNRNFTLGKAEWDSVALERVEMACDPTQHADLAAVVMQEGLAHVCLITPSMTLIRAKLEINIPRKRKGMCTQHDKGLAKFYDQIMQAILRHVNFDIVKCVLVASPGFVKDQFVEYMFQQALKLDYKLLLDNKSKFVLCHSSSGFKHSLKEVLQDPAITSKLADTKASGEVKALDDFYQMLQNDPNRAFYGIKPIEKAAEQSAIEVLLISDALFRSMDVKTRKRYVTLVETVRDAGGDVKIFSSLHVSGEQLGQLSGVAAILRFPMDDEDSDED